MLKFGTRIRTRALQGSSDDRWPSIQIPARDTSNPLEATYKLHGSILRWIVFDWTPAALLNSLYCTSTASLHLTLLPQSSLIKHSRHTISNAVSPSSRPRRNIRPPECLLTNSPGTSISRAQHQFNPGMISRLDLQTPATQRSALRGFLSHGCPSHARALIHFILLTFKRALRITAVSLSHKWSFANF